MNRDQLEELKALYYEPQASGYKTRCVDGCGNAMWVTEDNGVCHCFICGQTWFLDGVERDEKDTEPSPNVTEIRELYTELTRLWHTNLRREDIDFLHARGLDNDTIAELQLGYCPPDVINLYNSPFALEAGVAYKDRNGYHQPFFAGRLTIPYIVDGIVTDIRARSSDDPLKYKSAHGTASKRAAHYAYNWQDYPGQYVLTEGELKAAAAHQAGFKCIALPGMSTWRRNILPNAEDKVIVLFDSMRENIKRVQTNRAIARVATRIPNILVGTLPLLGLDKMDIDAYLVHPKGGKTAFAELLDRAIPFATWKQLQRF